MLFSGVGRFSGIVPPSSFIVCLTLRPTPLFSPAQLQRHSQAAAAEKGTAGGGIYISHRHQRRRQRGTALTQLIGIEHSTFTTVVDAVGIILVAFGIVNNPTNSTHL